MLELEKGGLGEHQSHISGVSYRGFTACKSPLTGEKYRASSRSKSNTYAQSHESRWRTDLSRRSRTKNAESKETGEDHVAYTEIMYSTLKPSLQLTGVRRFPIQNWGGGCASTNPTREALREHRISLNKRRDQQKFSTLELIRLAPENQRFVIFLFP